MAMVNMGIVPSVFSTFLSFSANWSTLSCFLSGKARWKIFLKSSASIFPSGYFCVSSVKYSVTICMLRRAVLFAMYWKSLALSLLLACVLPILINQESVQDRENRTSLVEVNQAIL